MSLSNVEVDIKNSNLKVESLCRLCLSTDAFLNIFDEEIKIIDIIIKSCPVTVSMDDELPKQICQQCMSTLNVWEDFKQKCIETDQELRNRLQTNVDTFIKTEQDYDYEDNDSSMVDLCQFKLESFNDDTYPLSKKTKKSKSIKKNSKSKGNKKLGKGDGEKVLSVRKKKIKKEKKEKGPKIKVHLCPICGKIFKGKSSASAHIKTHSNERPFVCEICKKSFRTKSHLNLHSSAHSDTRDFICSECPKAFKSKPDLQRHISIIHLKARRVSCEICGREVASKNNLKAHMLVHSGIKNFECSVCSQKFTFKTSLTTHFRIHSGEKPYLCKFCDARFTMQRSLRDHERLHTGETPYKCPCCPKAFNQLSNMKSHFRHNHRDVDFDKVYKGPRKVRYNP